MRITNLSRDTIHLDLGDSKFVSLPANASEGTRTRLQEQDVLISITADIGIVGCVDSRVPTPAYINQHIALVRFDPTKVSGKFVAYFLASEKPQKLFRASTDVGAKAGMSLLTVQKLQLALPPLPEQRAIAAALSDVDALIASLDKLITKKRDIKQAAMQQLLNGKQRLPGFENRNGSKQTDVGVIPADWISTTFGQVVDLLTGYPFQSKQYVETGIRLVRGSNVKRGVLDWSDDISQSWSSITPDISRYELRQGDLARVYHPRAAKFYFDEY